MFLHAEAGVDHEECGVHAFFDLPLLLLKWRVLDYLFTYALRSLHSCMDLSLPLSLDICGVFSN